MTSHWLFPGFSSLLSFFTPRLSVLRSVAAFFYVAFFFFSDDNVVQKLPNFSFFPRRSRRHTLHRSPLEGDEG